MCQKNGQSFKQFYALVLSSPTLTTRSLQVFKHPPTRQQIDAVIIQKVIGKIDPVPHLYAEKPKVEVIPIHIPVNMLYR
ncbi:MAG: hypothetical protein EBU66_13715 [Bacteroidetes bacterium]|jgi:hypothetical protein|nr:hypothetical protein [Bacteroidota bacterium]